MINFGRTLLLGIEGQIQAENSSFSELEATVQTTNFGCGVDTYDSRTPGLT